MPTSMMEIRNLNKIPDNGWQVIENAIKNENSKLLSNLFFGMDLTPLQAEIVADIGFMREDRMVVLAPSRYGKTRSIAIGCALAHALNKDLIINDIAPNKKQTKKFRDYYLDAVISYPGLRKEIDNFSITSSKAEKIKQEASKERIKFRSGNAINFLTAGGKNEGQSLMGEGGGIIIEDEACDIDDVVYDKRIYRQTWDQPDSMLIEIGNPWRPDNHFHDHYQSNRFKSIQIDWRDAVREGRFTKEQVEQARAELAPVRFKVLMEAEFPDTIEQGLFNFSWIKDALARSFDFDEGDGVSIWGLDVADQGNDLTVLTKTIQKGEYIRVTDIYSWNKKDPTETTEKVKELMPPTDEIHIDTVGVGSGVHSNLKHSPWNDLGDVQGINGGSSPRKQHKDEFANLLAKRYWNLREVFQKGLISIELDPSSNDLETLTTQLKSIQWENKGSGKKAIIKPDKSPDHADSLMYALPSDKGKLSIGSLEK